MKPCWFCDLQGHPCTCPTKAEADRRYRNDPAVKRQMAVERETRRLLRRLCRINRVCDRVLSQELFDLAERYNTRPGTWNYRRAVPRKESRKGCWVEDEMARRERLDSAEHNLRAELRAVRKEREECRHAQA